MSNTTGTIVGALRGLAALELVYVYWRKRETIPKLSFDGYWKTDSLFVTEHVETKVTSYCVRIEDINPKREGEIRSCAAELIYFGFDDQEILNLAWALQSNISIKDSLEKDLKKYGSLKKLIEGLDQESKKLEGQNKPVEAERDYANISQDELDEVREMQQHGAIAPLIRAARGELVEFYQLKRAVIGGINITLELLTSDQKASVAFKKAREIINKSHRQIA